VIGSRRDRDSRPNVDVSGTLLLQIADREARARESNDPAARKRLLSEAEAYRSALGELKSERAP
jgi:hypothetical protein